MEKVQVETTDPAKELLALAERLSRQSFTGAANTINALSRFFGVDVHSAEFLELDAAVLRRVVQLGKLAQDIEDSDFDPEHREAVKNATAALLRLFDPSNGHQPWQHFGPSCLKREFLTTLQFFSLQARRYRQLRVIPPSKREEVSLVLAKLIEDVRTDDTLEEWMRIALRDGLERCLLIIRHFDFFGHDVAIAEFFYAQQKFVAIARQNDPPAKERRSLWSALHVFAVIAELFALPHDVTAAITAYQDWYTRLDNVIVSALAKSHLPVDQKLLPAPDAVLPERSRESTS